MIIQIIFDSGFGGGRKAVEYLAGKLIGKGHEVTMNYVKESKPEEIPQADLYIFSTETHMIGPTRKIRKFIKKMSFPEGARYVGVTICIKETYMPLDMMETLIEKQGPQKAVDGLLMKNLKLNGPLEDCWEAKLDRFIGKVTAL